MKGALFTIDAAGTQTEIVNTIRDGGGDYLLAVEGNQAKLHAEHMTIEDVHGRHEERYATVIENPHGLPEVWRDVVAVIQVNRERQGKGKNVSTTHYYITSLQGSAEVMARLIRRHWAIENELHWVLVHRTAISLLKQEPSKISKHRKKFLATLLPEYLERLLRENMVI